MSTNTRTSRSIMRIPTVTTSIIDTSTNGTEASRTRIRITMR